MRQTSATSPLKQVQVVQQPLASGLNAPMFNKSPTHSTTSVSKPTYNHQLDPALAAATTTNATTGPPSVPGQTVGKCVYLETTNGDHTRFEVQVGYNKTLIDIFKLMKTKRYEPETKRWNFSTREYDELMVQVKLRCGATVKLEPLERRAAAIAGKSVQVKFTLSERNRFDAQAEYKPELKAIFDTIHSRKYDPNAKKYSFELKDYDELLKKIADKFPRGEVSVVALPKVNHSKAF